MCAVIRPPAAVRLGVYALVRLKAYPQLASAVLDPNGQPRVRWWPIAFALQRLEDKRALPALLTLAKEANPYTRAFAVKGLGGLKDPSALPVLTPLLSSGDRSVLIETIRALGRIGDPSVADALLRFIHQANTDPQVRLEAVAAIGGLRAQGVPAITDTLLDLLSDPDAGRPRGGAPLDGGARRRELHHDPVGARSRPALERPRRPRHAARHAHA